MVEGGVGVGGGDGEREKERESKRPWKRRTRWRDHSLKGERQVRV